MYIFKPSCPVIPCIARQILPRCNLTGRVIIISGILAVTLAAGVGVNCRTTVWSGVAPVSTLKGHADCTDLPCTLWHTASSHACLFPALPVQSPACMVLWVDEESGNADGKCASAFGVYGLGYSRYSTWGHRTKHSLDFKVFPGVTGPILWKRDDVHSVEGELQRWESADIYSWCWPSAMVMKAAPTAPIICPCCCLSSPAASVCVCISLLMCLH